MSNRVEDLERQVQELQAAVNGLTEELVETKARLRDLEAVEEETRAAAPPEEPAEVPAERTTKSDAHADVVEANPEAKKAREAADESGEDGAETETAGEPDQGEATKSEEPDESSGDGESEESDIIVA